MVLFSILSMVRKLQWHLSQLPEVATLHDVITIENEDIDLWSSIANVSQASADNTENTASLIYLDHQTVLDSGDIF